MENTYVMRVYFYFYTYPVLKSKLDEMWWHMNVRVKSMFLLVQAKIIAKKLKGKSSS